MGRRSKYVSITSLLLELTGNKQGASLRILLLPIFLHINWIIFTPLLFAHPPSSPFAPLLFISHPTPSPTDDITDPRYRKGWLDLVFIAYGVVLFSFVRQTVVFKICFPIARYFGIHNKGKLARFGEQGYAIVYFSFFGAWGVRIMSQLPTWWYNTQYFWIGRQLEKFTRSAPDCPPTIGYPHWQMTPALKRYYLMQASYWCQQFIVLVFRLEKPRKDYKELVAHHLVTLWLIGCVLAFSFLPLYFSIDTANPSWSYGINLTLIGNAVYTSMDIPDVLLAMTKVFNYLRWERAEAVVFAIFIGTWTWVFWFLYALATTYAPLDISATISTSSCYGLCTRTLT